MDDINQKCWDLSISMADRAYLLSLHKCDPVRFAEVIEARESFFNNNNKEEDDND